MSSAFDGESIAVIIPAFNAERTIGRCLSAIGAQTRLPSEVLVVDDGSTDNTSRIAAEWQNVRVLRNPAKGPAAARNYGAMSACSDWLAFIDSDCFAGHEWLDSFAHFQKEERTVLTGPVDPSDHSPIADYVGR